MKKAIYTAMIMSLALCISANAENNKYIVKKGDTLYSLSKRFNINMEKLSEANGISDPSVLYPGMEMEIPSGYRVEKGDTYYSIAVKHGMTLEKLLELNSLTAEEILMPGQILIVNSTTTEAKVITEKPADSENEKINMTVNEPMKVSANPEKGSLNNHFEGGELPVLGNITKMTGKLEGLSIESVPGEQVKAVSSGKVVWASEYGIYKYLVLIETRSGYIYGYGGNRSLAVKVGDNINPGNIIGILGGTGEKSSAYFFVYKDGKPVEPDKAPRV